MRFKFGRTELLNILLSRCLKFITIFTSNCRSKFRYFSVDRTFKLILNVI